MASLDVALRLRLINGLSGPARQAAKDLGAIGAAGRRTSGAAAGLNATGAATARLGHELGRVSTATVRADAGLRRVAGTSSGISATGAAAARLGQELGGVSTAAGRADAGLRRMSSERAGVAGLEAVSRALAQGVDRVATSAPAAAAGLRRVGAERAGIAAAAGDARALARDLDRAAAASGRVRPAPPGGQARDGRGRPLGRGAAPTPLGREQLAEREAAAGGGTVLVGGARVVGAIGGIYAARAGIRATVGEAISFEKAWAEVVKKVNDAPNPKAMEDLQRSVARTSIELGIPRQELAGLTAEAGAAGIKFGELERYVRLAAKASVGWDMTPRDASQKLAEIKTAGQYTIAEMDTLADKINALGDNSAAKEADIVEMMQRAAAPAKAAGVDTDTSLAALTALRSGGMQPEIAARFFGAFTSKIATAEGSGNKAKGIAEGFELLGLTVAKVSAGMKRDAAGTMIDILDRLAKHAEPAKVATKMMGQEWWDELARFSQSAPEFRKQMDFLKDPKNFSGSLGNNLNVQLATTANHLERLKALTGDVGDRLGRWALPGINRNIEQAIAEMDKLDQRRALRDSIEGPKKDTDPIGIAVTKTLEGADWLKNRVLDATIGALPTTDPARAQVEKADRERRDAVEAAEKARAEAAVLEQRAKSSKSKTVREPLLADARRAREAAAAHDATAASVMRPAGPAGARDMTGVEFGEAAARASIEARRRIPVLERALASGQQANVRFPDTGIIMSRQAVEAELAENRKRLVSLGVPATAPLSTGVSRRFDIDDVGRRSSMGAAMRMLADRRAAIEVRSTPPARFGLGGVDAGAGASTGAPRLGGAGAFPLTPDLSKAFDPAPLRLNVDTALQEAGRLRTGLAQDLGPPARESMEKYTTALKSGVDQALAIATAAAAQMRSALSFTATPTIAPSIAPRPAGGGGGGAGAATPVRATPGTPAGGGGGGAPRLQTAGLRGGGAINVSGPVHLHGVSDSASLRRELTRTADRQARDERDDRLHDTGSLYA